MCVLHTLTATVKAVTDTVACNNDTDTHMCNSCSRDRKSNMCVSLVACYWLPGYGDRRVWLRGPGWPDHCDRL